MPSLTWTQLPPYLLDSLMDQALTLAEAAELWDLCLLNPDKPFEVPSHLDPAVDRLWLWSLEAEPTRH